jgi:two-component system, chemotaxis family, protein-glutamate methylesterase/glutaminase
MAEEQVTGTTRLIVIGGSSGSLDALLVILPALSPDFTIPIIIVVHRNNNADNGLTELLAVKTSLHIKEADEKDKLLPGWIYLAPPDYHVLLEEDDTISLDASEKVNYCRPSIDVTFTSAAGVYKQELVAVLLSGANADGAQAMSIIKEYGGRNIVQDPAEALVNYMPEQAIFLSPIDHILPAAAIAVLLNKLAEK